MIVVIDIITIFGLVTCVILIKKIINGYENDIKNIKKQIQKLKNS